jgi:hypothetical protein
MTTRFCDNPVCENEAVGAVSVSVNTYADTLYNLCEPCGAAFSSGIQHGTFRTVDHMAGACEHEMGIEGSEGTVVPAPELFSESGVALDRVRARLQQYQEEEDINEVMDIVTHALGDAHDVGE